MLVMRPQLAVMLHQRVEVWMQVEVWMLELREGQLPLGEVQLTVACPYQVLMSLGIWIVLQSIHQLASGIRQFNHCIRYTTDIFGLVTGF
jgi:hypothetical protein